MSNLLGTEAEIRERLAANLRRLREQRGLSPDDIVGAAGIHRECYREAEAATPGAPVSLEEIVKIAVALGVDVAELFRRPTM